MANALMVTMLDGVQIPVLKYESHKHFAWFKAGKNYQVILIRKGTFVTTAKSKETLEQIVIALEYEGILGNGSRWDNDDDMNDPSFRSRCSRIIKYWAEVEDDGN